MTVTMLLSRSDEMPAENALPTNALRESSWADGLRGIAALFVVSSHLVLSFARHLVIPCNGENGPSVLWQRPFFRLICQGRGAVAIFFVLMAFVNPLKALKQARAGNKNEALSHLAKASSNRTGRLVFPAAAVTVISWLMCQLGFYDLALKSDGYWIRSTSTEKSTTWSRAILDLLKALVNTWFFAENIYDQPQWALRFLLQGSIYIFMTMLVTLSMKGPFRMMVEAGLYVWSWCIGDCLVGINIFAGMILSELCVMSAKLPEHRFFRPIPFLTGLLGLYLLSFPNEYADWAPWSRRLNNLGKIIFPEGADQGRFWPGIGAQILCFSIFFSPIMRNWLCHKYTLYLGGVSFPLYLLHGPLMRSVLAWLTFTPIFMNYTPQPGPNGEPGAQNLPLPRPLSFIIILPAFCVFLLWIVHLWSVNVEPHFANAVKRFEEFASGHGDKTVILPVQRTED